MKADCAERVHGANIDVAMAVWLLSSLIVLSHMGTGRLGIVLILEVIFCWMRSMGPIENHYYKNQNQKSFNDFNSKQNR